MNRKQAFEIWQKANDAVDEAGLRKAEAEVKRSKTRRAADAAEKAYNKATDEWHQLYEASRRAYDDWQTACAAENAEAAS